MIDLMPSPEQEAMQRTARRFALEVLRPAEIALDRLPDPEAVPSDERFRVAMAQAYDLGFHRMTIGAGFGGLGLDPLTAALVWEELAAGGVGFAATLLGASVAATLVARVAPQRADLVERFVRPFCEDRSGTRVSAWASTEPDVGSDTFNYDDPRVRHRVRAVADGEVFRIDGSKSGFVSNGGLADTFLVFANVDPALGIRGSGIFVVPAGEGVARGRALDKLGLRLLDQRSVAFDGVEVPQDNLVVKPGPLYPLMHAAMKTVGNLGVACLALGVLRAAYEEALVHAKDRVQFGAPVVKHQAVGFRLFECYQAIEAVRGLVWKAAWTLSKSVVGDLKLASAARVFATDQAMRHTARMLQVLGGYGASREYPLEKHLRDAKILQLADATNEIVSRDGAALL